MPSHSLPREGVAAAVLAAEAVGEEELAAEAAHSSRRLVAIHSDLRAKRARWEASRPVQNFLVSGESVFPRLKPDARSLSIPCRLRVQLSPRDVELDRPGALLSQGAHVRET